MTMVSLILGLNELFFRIWTFSQVMANLWVVRPVRYVREPCVKMAHLKSLTKAVSNTIGVLRTIPCPDICRGWQQILRPTSRSWGFSSDDKLGHISSYHLACEMLLFHVYFWYNFFFRLPYSPPTQLNAFFLIEFRPFWKFWVNLGFWLLTN